MLLAALQRELEWIYEIQVPLAVQDFLITDRDAISEIASAPPGGTHEALYLVEDEEGAALSLFIDESVLNRLAEDDRIRSSNYVLMLVGCKGHCRSSISRS